MDVVGRGDGIVEHSHGQIAAGDQWSRIAFHGVILYLSIAWRELDRAADAGRIMIGIKKKTRSKQGETLSGI